MEGRRSQHRGWISSSEGGFLPSETPGDPPPPSLGSRTHMENRNHEPTWLLAHVALAHQHEQDFLHPPPLTELCSSQGS